MKKRKDGLERQLGKVRSAEIYLEDHGCLTLYVNLEFGSSGQGFGGLMLGAPQETQAEKDANVRGLAAGLDFLLEILKLFGVDRLEQITGRPVYALRAESYGSILGLELPAFDDGREFILGKWRFEWWPELYNADGSRKEKP